MRYCNAFTFSLLCVWALSVRYYVHFLKLANLKEVLGVDLMKIRRRRSRKRYFGEKRVYQYERLAVDIPAKFGNIVEPFLNKDLDITVKKKDDNTIIIFLTPRENVSASRITP